MASSESTNLQYAPFSSSVYPGFWQALTEKKLNEYGLDESARCIHGFYSNASAPGIPPQISIDFSAFGSDWKPPARHLPAYGVLHNTNTIESFKEMDKKLLLNNFGRQMWEDMKSDVFFKEPDRLCSFILLTYADLKKYHYYYWFAFPALRVPEKSFYQEPPVQIQDSFSAEKVDALSKAYETYQTNRPSFASFFLVEDFGNSFAFKEFSDLNKDSIQNKNLIVGACDPSTLPGYPGWPIRNLISLFTVQFGECISSVNILCVRDRTYDLTKDFGKSLLFTSTISPLKKDQDLEVIPDCVGWEKNERQKMGPRMVNLSSSMDPHRLAESAVDLNLKLMRWRLLPELNLDKIASTKCLVLGSGTLGCNVARLMMGWGVRHITMVDNSRVSYSNPVRQTLFSFNDCLEGGQPKAQAAANALKNIFPGMKSEGLSLSIPMPGHPIGESILDQTKCDVKTLEDLIDSHDVVFLLMDTRESRWLPSVIAASKRKIVINAALGFDSYLVLRHGLKSQESQKSVPIVSGCIPGHQLGCYFCNDVVAPGNSTRDRTLDQQCTVTRPGISMVASALAVELLVSVLQHPEGGNASAGTSRDEEPQLQESQSCLGIIPHQIRGFLSSFHQILPASQSFDMCTACSSMVLDKYREEGFDFLLRAFNETSYLENLTGLTAMHAATVDADIWDLSDDEDMVNSLGAGAMDTQ